MNSDGEPPSFLSLPDDIVLCCLARISKSYYPKLSLVSNSFRSLISSNVLYGARFRLEPQENVLHVCLQLPDNHLPTWFSLWIKPDQILTNDLDENNKSSRNTLLVPVPSSYSRFVPPKFIGKVGSKFYVVNQNNGLRYSLLLVDNKGIWRKSPSMRVTRENVVAGILDEKIYVMGGCSAEESTNWAEVFDPKTQTWESLPDPGSELRFSFIKRMNVGKGKIYVRTSNETKDYVYDPKEGRWEVAQKSRHVRKKCKIEKVWYACGKRGCLWKDEKHKEWRVIKGLEVLNSNCHGGIIALANYGGKLLILWDKFAQPGEDCENKNIWCSVIALERRNGDDEVWGKVEWASVVLTVPTSYVFLRCLVE